MSSETLELRLARKPRNAAYYFNRRARRRQPLGQLKQLSVEPTVESIADVENLVRTFDKMKAEAGPAPGPDHITYADISRREAFGIAREISEAILEDKYRPGPTRKLAIPKLSGGERTLRIANLFDRVVARRLNEALQRLWEGVFIPESYGFRPDRGVWRLLAEMGATMISQDRWVLAIDDVRGAFDNVALDSAMGAHEKYISSVRLLNLIEVVLRGADTNRRIGIDQGNPYAPAALNVLLHEVHDLVAIQDQFPPWFRYADNLVYMSRSVSEGEQVLEQVQKTLKQAGFSLKGEDGPPKDLRSGDKTQMMGFTISEDKGRVKYDLGEKAWKKLGQNLLKAHETKNPSETAIRVVNGWIEAMGPAFESGWFETLQRVRHEAATMGFRELDSLSSLCERWKDSWERWVKLRKQINKRFQIA